MTSNDSDPEIVNLTYVFVTNHQETYRDRKFRPVVPDPPLPADFVAWLAAARRLGYYRVRRRLGYYQVRDPHQRSDILWAWPQVRPRAGEVALGQGFPTAGDRLQMTEADGRRPRPLRADRVRAGIRAWLTAQYRQLDADHMPDGGVTDDGQFACTVCGVAVRRDRIHHGTDL